MRAKITMNVFIAPFLVALLASTSVCYSSQASTEKTTAEEVKQKVQDAIQAIKSYSADQRDAAVKKVKTTLDALDDRIDILETRIDSEWEKMDQNTREKSRDALKLLRKKRNEVAEWYGAMKQSSAASWEHIKKGFSDAYEALLVAWEKTEKEFRGSKQ